MRCRKTASSVAEIPFRFLKLFPFCFLVLLSAFHQQKEFVEGVRFGRVLRQSNDSTTLESTPFWNVTVTDADSFRGALLQQNITVINIGKDIRLSSSDWKNGEDTDPATGIKISRNLTITTLPSLRKQRIIHLDYMVNRIIIGPEVTLFIDGVVFKQVNKIAERSITIPFIMYSDRSTLHIRFSQYQFAIDPARGMSLDTYPHMLESRQVPPGYENFERGFRILTKEECIGGRVRNVSCEDGALFVHSLAASVTPFNSTGQATGKAVFLLHRVLLDAKDARRFPDQNPSEEEVSNAFELRSAFMNSRIRKILVQEDIELTEGYFFHRERIRLTRDLTIMSHPDLNQTATIWLNYIEHAVLVDERIRLRVFNLGFEGVSRYPNHEDRIPFFELRDRANLNLTNVTSEIAINPNGRDSLVQIPFDWYGAVDPRVAGPHDNVVQVVNNDWCRRDGRIECPDRALLVTRGRRSFSVREGGVIVGQWWADFHNVLLRAIDITKPVIGRRLSPTPERSWTTEERGPTTNTTRQEDSSNENEDSSNDGLNPWILIYLLVATAGIMSLSLLVVTFYRRREQKRSVSPKESKVELSSPLADDGLREHQAIARQLLGDVKLGALLGCGSFGRVYKATWSGAQVAVKVILHQEDEDEVHQEAKFSMRLRHPNVVQTYHYAVRALESCPTPVREEQHEEGEIKTDPNCPTAPQERDHGMDIPPSWVKPSHSGQSADKSGRIPTEPLRSTKTATETSTTRDGSRFEDEDESWMEMWLVQEYCELGSVGRQNSLRLNSQNSVWGGRRGDLGAIIDTCKDVVRGMKYLHDNGIVHGDLKCDNLLLQSSHASPKGFTAKVADFGLSRKLGQVTHLSTKSFGTITHMPPELLLDGHLSPKVDVYSFGIIMWELWSGETPFRNMRYAEVMRAIVVDDRRPEFDGDAPPEYVSLSIRCWDKDPQCRPPFEQILEELDKLTRVLILEEAYTSGTSRAKSALTAPRKGKHH